MNYFIITFLVILALSWQVKSKSEYANEDSLTAEREAQFNCYKEKICTPGGPKVCGYDPNEPWLAVFTDICVMYKANCARTGRFKLVDQVVCDTRIQYDKEHVNETFEYIHVYRSTEPPTTVSHSYFRSVKAQLVL